MKETRFIAQNKEKWLESETLLTEPSKDPEKLSNLFTQVVDDLSYSRTYYKNRSVRVYLNNIAREYFSIIYSHEKQKKNRFRLFWLDELPQIILYSRKQLLISLFVFLLSAAMGVFSSMKDPQFASTILGDRYVSMTKENIKKGDPMAVYKSGHQVDMFLGITLNNLLVAFRVYVFGIFMSIGTLAILLYNGIMVGCFQFFFIERGLFAQSALSIWLHGTLEISSIILAGGAGLTLGSGLLFPGTYSRLQAFQLSAIRSLKLMLGITPIFVLAAIIESFLTRYTEVPDFVKLFLILLSAVGIIGYFVVYPWVKAQKGFDAPLAEAKIAPADVEPVFFDRIKNNAEIIKDAFLFYKQHGNALLSWIVTISLGMTVANLLAAEPESAVREIRGGWKYFFDDLFFALNMPSLIFIFINTLGSTLIMHRVFRMIDRDAKNSSESSLKLKPLLQTMLIMAALYTALYAGVWGVVLILFTFIFFFLFAFTQLTEDRYLPQSISSGWDLATSNFGQVIGLQFILLLMTYSFLLILAAPLLYINITVLQWNFAKSDVWSKGIVHFVEVFIKIFAFNLILPIFAACSAYLYFSLREVLDAGHLKKSIALVGTSSSRHSRK